ncbi:hypothetical protein ACFFUB_01215 [Algimonas porphyrae]|uniref:Lipoprotein n=1 Tax=Algimonas porphyrae TaxID=1128113 RepID=A0ABQ5UZM6_9PROT|nr:hypothetical protein [Algimonas porphyrae]GLQ20656.1 hypothetical protein GCM10007854_16110 [Algimonas porphyrae]
MKTKLTLCAMTAALLLTGCGATGIASAMAQKVASDSITAAQEKSRMAAVERNALAAANRDGDAILTCTEINVQLAEEAVLMAEAAENLGIQVNDYQGDAARNSAIVQAGMATGAGKAIPVVGGLANMAATAKREERAKLKAEAEIQFYGSRARRDVLTDLSEKAGCGDPS